MYPNKFGFKMEGGGIDINLVTMQKCHYVGRYDVLHSV